MDLLEIQTVGTTELFDLPQECEIFSSYEPEKTYLSGDDDVSFPTDADADIHAAETGVIEAIYDDDKSALVAHSNRLLERVSEPWDRSITSKLLHLCCAFDSASCAAALLDGELGAVPLVNEIDEAGKSPLHTAAEYHAARCAELLLRKRARTDVRTKDGRAQLALEMSLSSARMDVVWNPDDHSIEDLVVLLGAKDLTTIRLISEKTKEVAEVACAKAVEGHIVALATLLVVAAEKINDNTLELRDADSCGSKEKTTVYECVVREALSLGSETTSSPTLETAKNDTSCAEKRKLLLSEIELLQLFGVVAQGRCTDKKVRSLGPLFRAILAGDETVVALLLKTSIDIDETDAEGNSVLHYSVKTSRAPSPQEIKILILLLKCGARVSQKNKLGLTALHLAAGNGHLQALQILLLEDPESINYKTEVKETPLFFAVKNDHMDCAELLLRWGANSEVLNLRQRPIDLAKSQDMRFMLNPTNIGLMKRNLPVQQKHATWSQEYESFLDNSETLLSMTDEDITSERAGLSTTTDICKYFFSPHGCVRGEKCFYAHCEEVRRKVKQGTQRNRSTSTKELKNKIFVGGLPPSLNSALLHKYFEENFGPVQDAKVLETQIGNQTQSRGFGFVTFKDEKPVSAAVQAHYVTIMDKQVEIKSMLPRSHLENESQKLPAHQNNQGKRDKLQPQAHLSSEIFVEEDKPQQRSWLNNTLPGEITCSNDSQAQAYNTFEGQPVPTWLRIFNKWFPSLLQDVSKHSREGEYALSSLKGDFRAKFGLEMDHVSLGYPKLSDFMKCFSDLCCIKIMPIGRGGSPNHMVLVPRSSGMQQQLRSMLSIKSTIDEAEKHPNDSKSTGEELTSVSTGSAGLDYDCIKKQNPSTLSYLVNTPQDEDLLLVAQPEFMQLLKQDPLFHIRPWLTNECNTTEGNGYNEVAGTIEAAKGNNLRHQPQHRVLEAFARSRKNPSFYFFREFDFYRNYYASVKEGKCFACNEEEVLWANFPCQHLLWCIDCKMQASFAAGSSVHKCVICDEEVQKVDLLTRQDYQQLVDQYILHEEFPPFDPNRIRSPFIKKTSPFVSY